MFNKDTFAMMKKGAYLINNARGAIMDREALIEACESGQLAGKQTLPSRPQDIAAYMPASLHVCVDYSTTCQGDTSL